MTPPELADLVQGSRWVHEALGGSKTVLPDEQPTIEFAFASVVTLRAIGRGEVLTDDNVWVKRPGTGEIAAHDLGQVLGGRAARPLSAATQLRWSDVER
jgi:N-acetylneuraminate synthase